MPLMAFFIIILNIALIVKDFLQIVTEFLGNAD